MVLLTAKQRSQLLKNGEEQSKVCGTKDEKDFKLVVKLFLTGATWLLTELDPENPDIAFGLYDLVVFQVDCDGYQGADW